MREPVVHSGVSVGASMRFAGGRICCHGAGDGEGICVPGSGCSPARSYFPFGAHDYLRVRKWKAVAFPPSGPFAETLDCVRYFYYTIYGKSGYADYAGKNLLPVFYEVIKWVSNT